MTASGVPYCVRVADGDREGWLGCLFDGHGRLLLSGPIVELWRLNRRRLPGAIGRGSTIVLQVIGYI